METSLLKRLFCSTTLRLASIASKYRPIQLARLPLDHFGYSCSWGANLIAELENIPIAKRPIILFEKPTQVANKTLYQLWKRRFRFSSLINELVSYAEENKAHQHLLYKWRDEPYFDKSGLTAKFPPPVSFSSAEKDKAHDQLRGFGIDPLKPWVCLCVRELGYLTKKLGAAQSNENSYRQCSLQNYSTAVKHLLSSGIQVIRMGVQTEVSLEELDGQSGYFDYSQSERSEFLDIFLVSGCDFYLGDSDGLVNVARLFKRPTVIANWIPISLSNTARRNAILLYKPIFSKKTNSHLCFHELVSQNSGELLSSSEYEQRELIPHENSPEEILHATGLMLDHLEGIPMPSINDPELLRKQLRLREPLNAYLPQFDSSCQSKRTRTPHSTLETLNKHCRNSELAEAARLARSELSGADQIAWQQRIRGLACHWTRQRDTGPYTPSSVPLCYRYVPDELRLEVPPKSAATPNLKTPSRDKPIRLAYLSHDFRSHSAGVPLLPLLKSHNASNFSVLALNLGNDKLPPSTLYQEVHLFGLCVKEQSKILSELGIDLIVNTTDNLPNSCTELLKNLDNTPILSAWGYYPDFDDRMNNGVLVDTSLLSSLPKGSALKPVRIPSYHMQFIDSTEHIGTSQRPETAPIKIGAFNNLYKLDETLFNAWLEILVSIPSATLSLPEANQFAQRRISRRARQRGIDSGRIKFEARTDRPQHLKRLANYTLLLDNPSMGSGGQIFDALEAGTPFLTIDRKRFFHRSGTSISNTLNLTQFLAKDAEEYTRIAVSLLSDPKRLNRAREAILSAKKQYTEHTFPLHFSEYEEALRSYLFGLCPQAA